MIIIIDIGEEEEHDKDLEEDVFMENVFTIESKGIEDLIVPNTMEGVGS